MSSLSHRLLQWVDAVSALFHSSEPPTAVVISPSGSFVIPPAFFSEELIFGEGGIVEPPPVPAEEGKKEEGQEEGHQPEEKDREDQSVSPTSVASDAITPAALFAEANTKDANLPPWLLGGTPLSIEDGKVRIVVSPRLSADAKLLLERLPTSDSVVIPAGFFPSAAASPKADVSSALQLPIVSPPVGRVATEPTLPPPADFSPSDRPNCHSLLFPSPKSSKTPDADALQRLFECSDCSGNAELGDSTSTAGSFGIGTLTRLVSAAEEDTDCLIPPAAIGDCTHLPGPFMPPEATSTTATPTTAAAKDKPIVVVLLDSDQVDEAAAEEKSDCYVNCGDVLGTTLRTIARHREERRQRAEASGATTRDGEKFVGFSFPCRVGRIRCSHGVEVAVDLPFLLFAESSDRKVSKLKVSVSKVGTSIRKAAQKMFAAVTCRL